MTDETKPVRGGSFCSPPGATAQSAAKTPMICSFGDGQTRARWRRNGETPRKPRGSRRKASGTTSAPPVAPEQLADARPLTPVQLPAVAAAPDPIRDAIDAGNIGQVAIYCDGGCGTEYRGDFTGTTRHARAEGARAYLRTQGWQIGDEDLCPACGAKRAEPAPVASPYGSAIQDALKSDQPVKPVVGSPLWAAAQEKDSDVGGMTGSGKNPPLEEPAVQPKPAPKVDVVDPSRHTDRPFAVNVENDGMFHTYSATADALKGLGPDARIDMGGGVPLQDVVARVAMETGHERISPAEAPGRYREIAARMPEGSRAQRVLNRLADEVDGPPVQPMVLPDTVDPAVRDLVRSVEDLPAFRNEGNVQCYRAYQRVREIADLAASGAQRRRVREEVSRLYNSVHELNFDRGSQQFNRAVNKATNELSLRARPAQ
jgi:hypothetical protein